ncbi:hypothetical protein K440DRAFT_659399 [Wilcoxina mikolae CBS 423.85]|nr:hypothetical protein K440DRAFT_659399 [Wilcoxina mikolae CBS 423.85]
MLDFLIYPECLPNLDACDDACFYNKRLSERSGDLFTESGNVSVEVEESSIGDESKGEQSVISTITNDGDLDKYLFLPPDDIDHRFFILKPSNTAITSQCELHISEAMIRRLLTAFRVMPAFLDFVHAFGTNPDRSFGGCKQKIHFSGGLSGYEVCYNFKSAVPRRGKPPHNWSIRQTAVYQKFKYDGRKNIWILVQPETRVRERMSGFSKRSSPLEHHILFMSAAAANWRAYFNDLETLFLDMTINAVEKSVGTKLADDLSQHPHRIRGAGDAADNLIVEFRSVQILQKFEERVQMFKTALEINEDILTSLKALNSDLWEFTSDKDLDGKIAWRNVNTSLEQLLADILRHKRNVDCLLNQVQGRSRLLHNVLDYQTQFEVAKIEQDREERRHEERVERDRERMAIETERINREITRKKTFRMSEKTVQDTIGVKIMTIVALIYLPSTFVATFLQAGIITFKRGDDNTVPALPGVQFKQRLQYSRESLIFFFIIAIPLTVLTLGVWYILDKQYQKRLKKMQEKDDNNMLKP